MHSTSFSKRHGFTIVELLLIIVVVGILAAITVVAYTGIQKNTSRSVMMSDLHNAVQLLTITNMGDNTMPATIDEIMRPSPQVQLTLIRHGLVYYAGLSSAQNGLLFQTHCQDLINEGYGRGPNDFSSGTVDYITSCTVYNTNYLLINGWNGGFQLNNPNLTRERLQEYVDTAAAAHPLHPSFRSTAQAFMDELARRFSAQGGIFPVSFWNNWQTAPTLPPADTVVNPSDETFCIQATNTKFTDLSFIATSDAPSPHPGVCN